MRGLILNQFIIGRMVRYARLARTHHERPFNFNLQLVIYAYVNLCRYRMAWTIIMPAIIFLLIDSAIYIK